MYLDKVDLARPLTNLLLVCDEKINKEGKVHNAVGYLLVLYIDLTAEVIVSVKLLLSHIFLFMAMSFPSLWLRTTASSSQSG